MIFWNERILRRVTSDFLQRATSATSNERVLQRVTSNEYISTSNEQRKKSYASWHWHLKSWFLLLTISHWTFSVFKKGNLNLIRPTSSSFYNCDDSKGIKLATRLYLGLIQLHEHSRFPKPSLFLWPWFWINEPFLSTLPLVLNPKTSPFEKNQQHRQDIADKYW